MKTIKQAKEKWSTVGSAVESAVYTEYTRSAAESTVYKSVADKLVELCKIESMKTD